jgi:hypothetical protein
MAEIDSLPADQRAAVALLLKQGQTYDQLASLLGIGADAVRSRALAAVDTLGPSTDLSDGDRAAIADYLLGQHSVSEREAARDLIAGSDSAQVWARGAAGALAPLGRDALPDIPSAEGAPAPEPPAPELEPPAAESEAAYQPEPAPEPELEPAAYEEPPAEEAAPHDRAAPAAPARPSSRLGGALLLGGLGIIVAVVLILILNGGGDDSSKKSSNTLSANPSTQTTPGGQRPVAQVNLTSASGNSRQVGLAQVFENGSRRAIIVAGQGLEPGAYALWIYNSGSDAKLLGFVPERVGKDGRFATQGELPSNAEKYKQLVVTKESVTNDTKKAPSNPGDVVLQGDLKLG